MFVQLNCKPRCPSFVNKNGVAIVHVWQPFCQHKWSSIYAVLVFIPAWLLCLQCVSDYGKFGHSLEFCFWTLIPALIRVYFEMLINRMKVAINSVKFDMVFIVPVKCRCHCWIWTMSIARIDSVTKQRLTNHLIVRPSVIQSIWQNCQITVKVTQNIQLLTLISQQKSELYICNINRKSPKL